MQTMKLQHCFYALPEPSQADTLQADTLLESIRLTESRVINRIAGVNAQHLSACMKPFSHSIA